ncbi:MAG: hypothetical protein ACTHJJ_02785 [Intrasporangium sp.]|uniref:hypothetical protein n=1 Tax=Intrasporangium sp. TaxID=1925024 RepID=UPI003F7DC698
MDTTNSNAASGTDPEEGYVDQDSEPTMKDPEEGRPDGLEALKGDDLEAAKEHEGREEENVGAELLDSVSGGDDMDAENGHSAAEDIDDAASMRSGLSGKPGGGEPEGSTAP